MATTNYANQSYDPITTLLDITNFGQSLRSDTSDSLVLEHL